MIDVIYCMIQRIPGSNNYEATSKGNELMRPIKGMEKECQYFNWLRKKVELMDNHNAEIGNEILIEYFNRFLRQG